MRQHFVSLFATLVVTSLVPTAARAQTVLHLHKEQVTSPPTASVMRQPQPDAASFDILSPNRKNTTLADNYFTEFVSQPGDISNGAIASGSTFTFVLYMRKSAGVGVVYPRVMLRIANPIDQTRCQTNDTTEGQITQTLTKFTVTCTTSTALSFLSTTYYELWVGEHWSHSVTLEVDVEGTLNGTTDSTATVPTASPGSTITPVSPATGIAGQAVTINGSGFGGTPGDRRRH